MRKMLWIAGAAIAALSMPAFGQGHGHAGGGLGGGLGGGFGGGPPAGVPIGPPSSLPVGPPATIPVSPNANAHASGQVQGNVNAQTDSHASVRAHERTGASVDHGPAATGAGFEPRGLTNKTYRVGQHLSGNFKYYTDLGAIPDAAKAKIPSQYQTSAYRYIYESNRIYVVTRTTDKVATVVNLNP